MEIMEVNRKRNYKSLFISINDVWRYGNIGMDQLTGYLRKRDYTIDINYFKGKDSADFILENINLEYKFFGFSVNSSNYQKCCEISAKIKSIMPNAIICFGGGYPSRYYKEILESNKTIDFVILGDGEVPTEFLLEALANREECNKELNINHFAIARRDDLSEKHEYLNTEITYFPAFDYYEKDTILRNSRKVHCIQTKNNVCTGNCSFCTERHGRIVYKDLDLIIEQIKVVHLNYGVKKFFFTDDNILDPNDDEAKKRLYLLCQKLKALNLKLAFQCYMKAISLKDSPEDHELLSLMKTVGFVEIFIGLESGNQQDLNLYNKKTTVTDNYTIIRILREHGLIPIIGFISFNPYTTKKKIAENFKFLCDVQCTYVFNYLYSFVVINKYTNLYEKIKEDNLLLSPCNEYINIKYAYADKDVVEILDYIKFSMIPKLNALDYQLDWVTYSYEEHKIWYDDIEDFTDELNKFKAEDLQIIERYLGVLFIEHDLNKFKTIEPDFWEHFSRREVRLKEIYDYLILLHKTQNS